LIYNAGSQRKPTIFNQSEIPDVTEINDMGKGGAGLCKQFRYYSPIILNMSRNVKKNVLRYSW
jgi:hypothetical protein